MKFGVTKFGTKGIALSLGILVTLVVGLDQFGEKSRLDRQMLSLCALDGGVRLYESVKLPPDMFDQYGLVKNELIEKDKKKLTIYANSYIETVELTILKAGDPLKGEAMLERSHIKISRINDGKSLIEGVMYVRAGGDLWSPGHHSTATCPNEPLNLTQRLFTK